MRLLDQPILYLSKFVLRNRSTYYKLIRDVTEKARWTPWVEFMLEAVESTSVETQRVLRQVRAATDQASRRAREEMKRGFSRDLIDVVFSQPYTQTSHVVEAGIAQRNAAASYLKDLERIGILTSIKIGRDVLYVNPSLAATLEISLVE
jgi:Fic family protein